MSDATLPDPNASSESAVRPRAGTPSPGPAAPPGDPQLLLGRFEPTGPVGTSALGETRPAFDHELKRDVLLTRLPTELTTSERVEKQLIMEVEILTHLRDDSIIRVLDYVAGERCGYLVEDRFSGQDLTTFVAGGHQITPEEAEAIGLAVLRSLDVAHRTGIMHRDLRPEHIWILDDGSIRVRGFGLARLLREQRAALQRSVKDRARILAYAPPEDVLNQGMDHRGDLYAFGCILYQLHTGQPPFTEGNVAYSHVHHMPTAPSELNPSIPERVEQVILGCLAKHPDERFQTAADAHAVLEVPVVAAAGPSTGRRRRSSPMGLVAAAAVLVVAAAGAVFFYQQQRKQAREGTPAVARTPGAPETPRPRPPVTPKKTPPKAAPAKVDPKAVPKVDPKAGPTTDPKVDPKADPKAGPTTDPKADPGAAAAPTGPAKTPEPPAKGPEKGPEAGPAKPGGSGDGSPPVADGPSPPGPPREPTPDERFSSTLGRAAGLLTDRKFAESLKVYQEAGELLPERSEVNEGISRVYAAWGDALAAQGQLLEAQETYRLGLRYGEDSRDRLLAIRDRIHESLARSLEITMDPPGPLLTTSDCRIRVNLGKHSVKEVRLGTTVAKPDADGAYTFLQQGLAEGDHTFRIEIRDGGDNVISRDLSVHVDTQAPTVVAFEPKPGEILETSQVVLRGEASEPIAAVWCEPEKQEVAIKERGFTVTVAVTGLYPVVSFAVEDRAGHRSETTRIKLYNPGWVPPGLEPRGDKFFSLKDKAYMVRVPGVEFLVRDDHGRPRRHATEPFFVDVTEVTNARYRRFLEWVREAADPRQFSHPSEPANKDHTPALWNVAELSADDKPVVGVDWWDAYAYAGWAGKSLLSDATWVLAARGVPEAVYPWGDAAPRRTYANYVGSEAAGPMPVMSFAEGRSPFGCHDMAGNVMEWCLDTYPQAGRCLVRGGSWFHSARFLRVNTRVGYPVALRTKFIGFRCARYISDQTAEPAK